MIIDREHRRTRDGDLTEPRRRRLVTLIAGIAVLLLFLADLFPESVNGVHLHDTYVVTGPGALNLVVVPMWAWYAFAKRFTRRRWLAYAHASLTIGLLCAAYAYFSQAQYHAHAGGPLEQVQPMIKSALLCLIGLAATQVLLVIQAVSSSRVV